MTRRAELRIPLIGVDHVWVLSGPPIPLLPSSPLPPDNWVPPFSSVASPNLTILERDFKL